jgi:antitoxin MazE
VKARIVQIGKSRGVRIPKLMLEEAGLSGEVEIQLKEGVLVIQPIRKARAGWDVAYRKAARQGEDMLLDAPTPTHFDEEDWEWE